MFIHLSSEDGLIADNRFLINLVLVELVLFLFLHLTTIRTKPIGLIGRQPDES
jgi:hypothetical protein